MVHTKTTTDIENISPLRQLLICIFICAISIVACLDYYAKNDWGTFPFDDSYITLQLAKSIQNPHSSTTPFTGATSPLHIITLSLIKNILQEVGISCTVEAAALIVGILFHALSCILLFSLARETCGNLWLACIAGIALATHGVFIFDALNGLETTLYCFFSLSSIYCFIKWRRGLYYLPCTVLCILTRPEGWILFAAFCVFQLWQFLKHREKILLYNLVVSIVFIPLFYSIFIAYAYGWLFPFRHNTFFAKMLFFGEWMFPVAAKTVFLCKGIIQFLKQMFPSFLGIIILAVFAQQLSRYFFLALYPLGFYFGYWLLFPGATGHYGCRYQHIFIPLIILALICGAWTIVNKVRQKTIRLVLVMGFFAYLTYSQGVVYQLQKQGYQSGTSFTRWIQIELASWIKQNTPPDTTIALHDIGAMGYFSERKLIDLVGLTNPEVLDCYWDGKNHRAYALEERDIMEYLKRKRPEYLIVVSDWDRYFNFSRHKDEHILKLVHESYPIPFYNTKYLVYQCIWQK